MNPLSWIDDELALLEENNLRRHLLTRDGAQSAEISIYGRKLINFGSNDYLALARDSRLGRAAAEAISSEGWGGGASPLITGHSNLHRKLEKRLAEFENAEAALVFTSGFAANSGAVAALVGPGDVIYCDSKNHASLWDGCRLSRADIRAYPHNEWRRLDSLLAGSQHKYRRRLIVTDGLFSMDGDTAPLVEIADLAEQYGAMLLVDEAHATGVFGQHGRGVCEHLGVENRVHIRAGTLSKALGCMGGFVVGSRSLIEWLLNRARPYIFSTAAPAANAAAAMAALDIVQNEPQQRRLLLEQSEKLRRELNLLGYSTGESASQIIPIVVGDSELAVMISAELRNRGLFVPAIRPPTVPNGEACLRVSLTTGHTDAMITALLTGLQSAVAFRQQ